MSKEELIKFLKENLRVHVTNWRDSDGDINTEVSLSLFDVEFTKDRDYHVHG